MSYILDAIRKSEQQRQRETRPALPTVQVSSYAEAPSASPWYVLLAAVLICAGILIGWWRPWQKSISAPVVEPAVTVPNSTSVPRSMSVPTPPPPVAAKETALPLPAEKVTTTHPPVRDESKSRRRDTPAVLKHAPPVRVAQPIPAGKAPLIALPASGTAQTPAPSTEKSVVAALAPAIDAGSGETAQEQKIIGIAELPLAIQQEIPKMTISGYAYSSVPRERSVGINDHLLQEGDTLVPGLRLEQINPDNLVFSYKKYRFRHGL